MTNQTTKAPRQLQPIPLTFPRWGSQYSHYKGGIYTVLGAAHEESSGQVMIVYQSLSSQNIFVRPFKEWFEPRQDNKPRFYLHLDRNG